MTDRFIAVFETKYFIKLTEKLLSAKEHSELITHLKANPKDGDVIAGTGGIRKLRWGRQGSGKRGGVRVIYYFYDKNGILIMLKTYAKNAQTDLSAQEKQKYSDLVKVLIETFNKR
jgi:hypothetical protein